MSDILDWLRDLSEADQDNLFFCALAAAALAVGLSALTFAAVFVWRSGEKTRNDASIAKSTLRIAVAIESLAFYTMTQPCEKDMQR